jgi:hypothetical protein
MELVVVLFFLLSLCSWAAALLFCFPALSAVFFSTSVPLCVVQPLTWVCRLRDGS